MLKHITEAFINKLIKQDNMQGLPQKDRPRTQEKGQTKNDCPNSDDIHCLTVGVGRFDHVCGLSESLT